MVPAAGYSPGEIDIPKSIQRLEAHINDFPRKLQQLSKEELLTRPASGKWSKKEILGHLVDSAINNLKRFTEIQFEPQPYTVISYKQDLLVTVNNYQALSLEHLLQLWQSLNRQIVYVVQNIPAEKLDFKVDPQYENKELKTLGWIISDYVAHMEHHFHQVFG